MDEIRGRKPVSDDLEEAAEKFARFYDNGTCDGIAQDCFIAGAKWQKEKMIKEMFAEQGTTEEEYLDKSMAQVREMYKKLGITMAKEDKK